MASWGQLLEELGQHQSNEDKTKWLIDTYTETLQKIAAARGSNVFFYSSGFLQKPGAHPALIQITAEDMNGFMSAMYGADSQKPLTLLLHTPGGVINSAESIVQYLHSKFPRIEVIVPTFAMSAGTMISLSADKIIMGRQSQLGPIDPQMPIAGKFVSARAVVDQFERAKAEVSKDLKLGHVWAPILQSLGPALLVEAENALDYGERMVAMWLKNRMFKDKKKSAEKIAKATAKHFNDAKSHKSHGRRIDRDEARTQHVIVDDLEADQDLQDLVLTAYHLTTITFEHTPVTKMIATSHGQRWIKSLPLAMPLIHAQPHQQPQQAEPQQVTPEPEVEAA